MFYMHDIGWGRWLLMSLGMVAFWGVVIYAVVWFVRGQSPQRSDEPSRELPEEILKRRLARGEISIDEYERLHEALEHAPHEPLAA